MPQEQKLLAFPSWWSVSSAVLLLLLLTITVRCAYPFRLAIEHFDEGVYASDVWFGAKYGYAYPFQHLYAPKLIPILARWSLIFSGAYPAAPIWIGILSGCATVPCVYYLGRKWFGPLTGLVAAMLAATSDVHALFSRTILTDATLLLWMILAIYFMHAAIVSGGWRNIICAGGLTGLAWWTKYNGWLPLAVGIAGISLHAIWKRPGWRSLGKSLAIWGAIGGIAIVLWLPVPYRLIPFGGYGEVVANHRRYYVGLNGWVESLFRQISNLSQLEGWFSLALGPLVMAVAIAVSRLPKRSRFAGFAAVMLLGASFIWCGQAIAMAIVSICAFGFYFFARASTSPDTDANAQTAHEYAVAFLAAWFGGLFIATPSYSPYVRLTLPWTASAWIASGWAIAQVVEYYSRREDSLVPLTGTYIRVAIACTLLLLAGWLQHLGRVEKVAVPAWIDRRDLTRVAYELADIARQNITTNVDPYGLGTAQPNFVVTVYGEPAIVYQLHAHLDQHRWPFPGPIAKLEYPPESSPDMLLPTFLIVGPHAEHDPNYEREFASIKGRLQLLAVADFRPSPVVRLDQFDPITMEIREQNLLQLKLYRVR